MQLLGILLDLLLLFGLVGGLLYGLRSGLVRTIVSTVVLFLSATFAALLYTPLINIFTAGVGTAASARTGGSVVFFGLTAAFYAILEYTVHRNYPDLHIQRLKRADNILGAIFGVLWATLGLSLLLLVADFGSRTMGGPVTSVSEIIYSSKLVPLFRQFFKLPLAGMKPLFPNSLPEILLYFTV